MDKYRVRKGLFGRSVLQKLYNQPSFIGGKIDVTIREIEWRDVPFDHAPMMLRAEIDRRGKQVDADLPSPPWPPRPGEQEPQP